MFRKTFEVKPETLQSAYQMQAVDRSIQCEVCTEKEVDNVAAVIYCTDCPRLFCLQHEKVCSRTSNNGQGLFGRFISNKLDC